MTASAATPREPAAAASDRLARLGVVRRLRPGGRPARLLLPRPARDHRLLLLLGDHRLRRRPPLDARQLPLLLQRLDLRRDDVGDALGRRSLATAIAIGMAFPFAYWLSRYVPQRLRAPLLVLVIVPFWTSYLLRVYSWLTILGDAGRAEPVPAVDAASTNHPIGLFLYDRPAVILVLVYLYFPFAALTLYSSIERFDWDQLRAAMDLGAAPRTAIRGSWSRRSRPGIVTAVIFVFIPVLGEYLTPQIVGGTRRRDDRQPRRQLLPGGRVHARGARSRC